MNAHTPAAHELLDWLREREANARRIANSKLSPNQASDRAGWLEDAEYFSAAAKTVWDSAEVVAVLKDVLRIATAASIGVAGNQPRLERARAVIDRATTPSTPNGGSND